VQGFHGDMADLPLISAQERELLVHGCNQSAHAYPLERSYIELFEAQVAQHPERIAATCLDQHWTYAELNRRSNGLGHALIAAGVGLDQPVALLAERSLDVLGMIIGSFKAGAGYLPLDPGLPSQRLSRIIELSRTPLLVCTEACREQAIELLQGVECQLLVWEDVPGRGANPGIYSGPDNLAYVIYTSGSTGLRRVSTFRCGSSLPRRCSARGWILCRTQSPTIRKACWRMCRPRASAYWKACRR